MKQETTGDVATPSAQLDKLTEALLDEVFERLRMADELIEDLQQRIADLEQDRAAERDS